MSLPGGPKKQKQLKGNSHSTAFVFLDHPVSIVSPLTVAISIGSLITINYHFLDASSHLYIRLCLSVGWSVRPLVGLSVTRFFNAENERFSLYISSGQSN